MTPGEGKPAVRLEVYARAEPLALLIQRLQQPVRVLVGCAHQLKAPDLKGHHFETDEIGTRGIDAGKVHQGQIIEENTPHEFFTNPQSDRAQNFLSKILNH